MEKGLTPEEAFDDFLVNVYEKAFPPGKKRGAAYNRVKQALYARQGKGKRALTKEWVAAILEDYGHLAPGRYRIVKGIEIFVGK